MSAARVGGIAAAVTVAVTYRRHGRVRDIAVTGVRDIAVTVRGIAVTVRGIAVTVRGIAVTVCDIAVTVGRTPRIH